LSAKEQQDAAASLKKENDEAIEAEAIKVALVAKSVEAEKNLALTKEKINKIPARFCGWMDKQPQKASIGAWQKRFFICDRGVLTYFEREKVQTDKDKKARGEGSGEGESPKGTPVVLLNHKITSIPGTADRQYQLSVKDQKPNGRNLIISMSTNANKHTWLTALAAHAEYLNEENKK
jgi:hypothetical protein